MNLKIVFFILLINVLGVLLQENGEFVSQVLSRSNKGRNPNWFSFAGKTYYFGTIFKANFFRAMQFCRQQKMHLVSINSQIENDRLGKFVQDNGFGNSHFWTSATNQNGDNEWIWLSTGQKMIYSNWYPGEPSNLNSRNSSENCVEVRHWAQPSGFTWNDLDCLLLAHFICESTDADCPIKH